MMNRKLAILAALAALCFSTVARAVTDAQDGNSTRGVQQARLGGMLVRSDSTMDALSSDGAHGLKVTEGFPINTSYTYYPDAYADTLSYNGRSLDSTSVISCGAYSSIVFGVKMEGAWNSAAAQVFRIGITCIMSMSPLATDTTQSFVVSPTLSTKASGAAAIDSTGFMADGVATTNSAGSVIVGNEVMVRLASASAVSIGYEAYRTASLSYTNPGYRYVRWKIRVLTEPVALDAGATKRQTFRLRCAIGMRAL